MCTMMKGSDDWLAVIGQLRGPLSRIPLYCRSACPRRNGPTAASFHDARIRKCLSLMVIMLVNLKRRAFS